MSKEVKKDPKMFQIFFKKNWKTIRAKLDELKPILWEKTYAWLIRKIVDITYNKFF